MHGYARICTDMHLTLQGNMSARPCAAMCCHEPCGFGKLKEVFTASYPLANKKIAIENHHVSICLIAKPTISTSPKLCP